MKRRLSATAQFLKDEDLGRGYCWHVADNTPLPTPTRGTKRRRPERTTMSQTLEVSEMPWQ